jgi:hypothetical protein
MTEIPSGFLEAAFRVFLFQLLYCWYLHFPEVDRKAIYAVEKIF